MSISGPKGDLFEMEEDMGCPKCKGTYNLRVKDTEPNAVWVICTSCQTEFALRPEAVPTHWEKLGEPVDTGVCKWGL